MGQSPQTDRTVAFTPRDIIGFPIGRCAPPAARRLGVALSQTVERAIDILEYCATSPRTIGELSERFGVHRTTVSRLAATLEERGFIRRQADGRYGVGLRLVALADSALHQFDLRMIVHPFLQQLSDTTGQTVQFATREGDSIVYVDKIEPPASIRLDTTIGGRAVVQTAGVAKAIMAYLPEDEVAGLLSAVEWRPYTANSLSGPDAMRARLEQVRACGWAYDDGEYDEISNCVAAPVRDYTGNVFGAVSITAIKTKVDLDGLKAHLPALMATTAHMSEHLGWRTGA